MQCLKFKLKLNLCFPDRTIHVQYLLDVLVRLTDQCCVCWVCAALLRTSVYV